MYNTHPRSLKHEHSTVCSGRSTCSPGVHVEFVHEWGTDPRLHYDTLLHITLVAHAVPKIPRNSPQHPRRYPCRLPCRLSLLSSREPAIPSCSRMARGAMARHPIGTAHLPPEGQKCLLEKFQGTVSKTNSYRFSSKSE